MRWDFTPRRLKFWVEAKHFISNCSLWLERANFWSGVWRTTIAPRCPQSSEQGHKESDMCSHPKSNTVSFSPGLWISIYHSCLNLRDWKCHKRSTLCSLYIPPKLLKVMKGVVCIFYLYLSFQSLSKFSNDFKFTGPGVFIAQSAFILSMKRKWTSMCFWPRRDLNTQPSDLESDALPLRHEVPHVPLTQALTVLPKYLTWLEPCKVQEKANSL